MNGLSASTHDDGLDGSLDDAELCRRVLAGETRFYAHLVRRHQPGVFRVAAAMLGDPAATDAIVQQVFINAYEHLDSYRSDLPFSPWIKTIARNLVRKEALRADREQRRLGLYREFVQMTTEPDDELEQSRIDEALRSCREGLAPTAARAIVLRYEEGRSLEDVAAVLGRGVGATRQLLFRVRAVLRDCVDKTLGEAEGRARA